MADRVLCPKCSGGFLDTAGACPKCGNVVMLPTPRFFDDAPARPAVWLWTLGVGLVLAVAAVVLFTLAAT